MKTSPQRIRSNISIVRASLLLLLTSIASAQVVAEITVIGHLQSDLDSMTLGTVRSYYLGHRLSSNAGGKINIVMLNADSPTRTTFDRQILEMETETIMSRWSGLMFAGKANDMPKVLNSDEEVIAWVMQHKDAIGYIDNKYLTEQVKVLYTSAP